MTKLENSLRYIDVLNEWVGKTICYMVPGISVLVVLEVIMRYFFNAPSVWNNELVQMLFGGYGMLAGGYVLLKGGHVSVDILYSRFSTRGRALLDIITSPMLFIFCGVLFIYGLSYAMESVMEMEHTHSAWNPPLYPVKITLPLGVFLVLLQGGAILVRNFVTYFHGEK